MKNENLFRHCAERDFLIFFLSNYFKTSASIKLSLKILMKALV